MRIVKGMRWRFRGNNTPVATSDHNRRVVLHTTVFVYVVATVLQIAFWAKQSVGGDQRVILNLGREYAESNMLKPSEKGTSGGGRVPGALMQWFVGTSLRIWPDHRAPGIPLIAANALSLLIFGMVLRRLIGPEAGLACIALYGLSPWRLFNCSVLWEPAYLFLPATIHFWACATLRARRTILPSLLIGASVVWAFQFHASFMVLAVATGILVLHKEIHLHGRATALGCAISGIPFMASLFIPSEDSLMAFAPHYQHDLGSSVIISAANVPKALCYWLRMGSADVGRRLTEAGMPVIVRLLAMSTVTVSIVAAVRAWHAYQQATTNHGAAGLDADAGKGRPVQDAIPWVLRYVLIMFTAFLLSAVLSPVTLQSWHSVVTLPAALIPPAMFLTTLWLDRRLIGRILVVTFLGILVGVSLALLLRHPLSTG